MEPRRPTGKTTREDGEPGAPAEPDQEREVSEDLESQARIMDALLVACGEMGYRRLTVEDVLRGLGGSRKHFYRHFEDKADCYAAAYDRESERLSTWFLSLSEGKGDGCGLSEPLEALAGFIAEEPLRAKALFVEVHVAGGSVLRKREEVFERLSHALDSACREKDSRHVIPPLTAEFMINVVDQAVSRALTRDEPQEFAAAVPELVTFICRPYTV